MLFIIDLMIPHNGMNSIKINDLYCSPNIVRVIKSRRTKWAGHVARMGEEGAV